MIEIVEFFVIVVNGLLRVIVRGKIESVGERNIFGFSLVRR